LSDSDIRPIIQRCCYEIISPVKSLIQLSHKSRAPPSCLS
jgi:hypothetical protein